MTSLPAPSSVAVRIVAGFALAVGLLAIIGVVSYRSTTRFIESADWVSHTREVATQLEELRWRVTNLQNEVRGYVILGGQIDVYRGEAAAIDVIIKRLLDLTADNRAQQQRLEALQPLIARELAFIQRTIAARAAGGMAAAAAVVEGSQGVRTIDAMNALITAMNGEEDRLLHTRQSAERQGAQRAVWTFALLFVLLTGLLCLATYLVWRDLQSRELVRRSLQAAHDRLGQRVEERTRELERSHARLDQEAGGRQRALAALHESEARTSTIVDTVLDGIITIDRHGMIHTFNPAAERIFGYAAPEVIGQNVRILMPSPYREEHQRYLARYLETGEKRIIGLGREVVGQRRDGTTFPLELAVSELPTSADRMFTGVVRDVTERKRAEAEVRELQRLARQRERLADIGAITAQIVHDLGNPLAGIAMQARLILRRAARDPQQPVSTAVKSVERIVAEVDRLDGLIKEFMDFSREQRLDVKAVRLQHFLWSVLHLWEPLAAARDIGLTLDLADQLPAVAADEEKLHRVFENLVKNALEAIDHGPGAVHITARLCAPDTVRVSVADTGPGMAQTLQPFRLFETTKPQGSGLGLAIVRQIILAHGGRIDIESACPHGAVFHIELPRHPEPV